MRRRIPVLLYHIIGDPPEGAKNSESYLSVKRFTSQMSYLQNRGYKTISPDELVEHYTSDKPLPRKSVLITFDDGSRSILNNAFPIMKEIGFTGTVFLISDYIGKEIGWDGIQSDSKPEVSR